jgi:DNA primase
MQCINQIPTGFYRDLMLNDLADQLSMDRKALNSFIKPDPKPTSPAPPQPKPLQKAKKTSHTPPAIQLAMTLLVHHPELSLHLEQTIDSTPESSHELQFLTNLITVLKQHPTLTTGQLHAYMEDERSQQLFATATNKHIELPHSALSNELKGAIEHIQTQQQQEKINTLIKQSKVKP